MPNLLHVAVHGGANQNAGDVLLAQATRWLFDQALGPNTWALHQAWAPFHADWANTFDGVVVGGGGMLLPDQEGADYAASGWQWNCTLRELGLLTAPLIVFGIGMNRFRGQADFAPPFYTHLAATQLKSAFFSLREHTPSVTAQYQPCPTTCLWQLLGMSAQAPGKVLGLNVATDRTVLRFGGSEAAIFEALTDVCAVMVKRGWTLRVLCHKPQDRVIMPWLVERRIAHQVVPLWHAKPEDIVRAYQGTDLVIGMRGHAQLIPFGLRKRIVSIISHDKVARFLTDIGHEEWGVDVQSPTFGHELCDVVHHVMTSPTIAKALATAQEALWTQTQRNMQWIRHALTAQMASCS